MNRKQKFTKTWILIGASIMLMATILFCPGLLQTSAVGQTLLPPNPSVFLPLLYKNYSTAVSAQNIFGVESYNFVGDNERRGKELGIAWLRRNSLMWSSVEAAQGVYDWTEAATLEKDLINASNAGIKVILIVRGTPSWAQQIPPYECGPIRSDKLAAFGNFMFKTVQRYSQPPYNVKYWQLWNEPDVDPSFVPPDNAYGCWANFGDPYYGGGYYAEMLKAAYGRIKQADPQAQVLIGGLMMACEYNVRCNWQGSQFLEGILRHNGANDGKEYFDIVAFHGYSDYDGYLGQYSNYGWSAEWNDEGPALINKARFIKSVLTKYGATDKGIMATEIALRCINYSDRTPCTDGQANFLPTKNSYIAQAFAAAIAEGLQAAVWYDLSGSWMQTALLTSNHQYTDAFFAFKTARDSLQGATFSRKINNYSGVKGYEFTRGGRTIWLIWSGDGAVHPITLPSVPASAWDVLKNPVAVPARSLSVSLTPTYLEW